MRLLPAMILAAASLAATAPEIHPREMTGDPSRIYQQARGLRTVPRLIELAPGAVRPNGWLADWARAAAEGITGDLDTRAITFREAWN